MASSATATATVALAITSVIRRGEVVELKGRTERGASVMINGERVPVVRPDGTFVFFFLVPDGPYAVSVTAQNSLGAVRTLRHPIE